MKPTNCSMIYVGLIELKLKYMDILLLYSFMISIIINLRQNGNCEIHLQLFAKYVKRKNEVKIFDDHVICQDNFFLINLSPTRNKVT